MRDLVVGRLRKMMADDGLAAVVIGSPESLAHVNGFVIPSQPLMRWRHAFAVITADGRLGAVCVDMEESTVRRQLPATVELRVWREFSDDPMAVLSGLLIELGLSNDRIGLELDFVPAGDFARLQQAMPAVQFAGVERALARVRQIKDADEVALLRRLSRISEQAITDAFDAVGPGSTELDLAGALTTSVYSQGADQFKLMIVATGERSQLPNVGPTDRVLEPGDICRVEIFSVLNGYQAGICRTAAVSHAPEDAIRIWKTLGSCKQLLLDTIASGVSTRHVWDVFRAEFDRLQLPPISFVGHGIGVHLHEEPYIGPFSDQELEAGMVLGIEPLVYNTGLGFGMQLKDMVTVTEGGCELLSDLYNTDELPILG